MNRAWREIVIQEIKEQYDSETDFYRRQLGMDELDWIRWKKGDIASNRAVEEKISRLFTDYERMLVGKVTRNAAIIPEVQMDPVREYKQMKLHIAKRWIKSGMAMTEWITEESPDVQNGADVQKHVLRVELDYQFWSYSDRLEFRVRHLKKKEMRWTAHELLEWFDQKIDEQTVEMPSRQGKCRGINFILKIEDDSSSSDVYRENKYGKIIIKGELLVFDYEKMNIKR